MLLEIRRNKSVFNVHFNIYILPLIQLLVLLLSWQPFKVYTHINIINILFECVCALQKQRVVLHGCLRNSRALSTVCTLAWLNE